MFSCKYYEIFKNTFLIEHLRWLFLFGIFTLFQYMLKLILVFKCLKKLSK